MYQSINFSNFQTAFQNHNRADQFSPAGLRVLFDYLEQLEDETGERIELDVIALCCEYEETTLEALADKYSIDIEGVDRAIAYLRDHTQVAGQTPTGIVFQSF